MVRQCRICLQVKDETEFASNGRRVAVENRCKKCVSDAAAVRRKLKKTAPPKPKSCECCDKETNRLCLDHCHNTLEFRGWICEPCNRGIGQLGDTIEGLQKAMAYLDKEGVNKSNNDTNQDPGIDRAKLPKLLKLNKSLNPFRFRNIFRRLSKKVK